MARTIDLRSDTVARPTTEMLEAMMRAEVGDDVFGEDPTAEALEAEVAQILGKEAALFVPSGTMANQIAILLHTRPGDEVVCEADCHIAHYESGAPAALSGVLLRTVHGERGVIPADKLASFVRHGYDWEARSSLLWIENTHNRAGGTVYPISHMEAVCERARDLGLTCHLDGARLWNASAASGIPESRYAGLFDTVSVCLSKGLGAPVGSCIAGTSDRIRHARRYRKMLGGGMRQVGYLAAAGLFALENNRAGIARDHVKARRLARGLAAVEGFGVDPDDVDTNIVLFETKETAPDVLEELDSVDVLMVPFGPNIIRAVTHQDVSEDDIQEVIDRVHTAFGAIDA